MSRFENIYLYTLRVKQLIIGPVVKQYGPFRLHTVTYALKSGRILNSSRYFVVVGQLTTPLAVNYGASDDPHGYTRVVRRREGPFRECVHVGEISIKRSTYCDLYDAVDYWLKYIQTKIECYAEQLAIAGVAPTRNLRRAAFYRKNIAEMEAELAIVGEAFRAFLLEYPDAAVGTKRTVAKKAQEARRLHKTMQRGIWAINKFVK